MGAKKKNDNKAKLKGDTAKKGGNADGGSEKNDGGKLKGGQAIVVRHILCTKHSKKEEALAQIKRLAEEDKDCTDNVPRLRHFQEVAKLYSEDKAKDGGRLGERTKGSLLAEFEKVAYTLKPEKSPNGRIHIGEAKTEHGYHLIVVEERK